MSARAQTILGVAHTAPAFEVPRNACDCHTHIFGPADRFPYSSKRLYTPGDASMDDLSALHRALHIDRVVIVHPSPYGADNSCTQFAVLGLWTARRHDVPLERVLAFVDKRFRLSQAGDGGWGYNDKGEMGGGGNETGVSNDSYGRHAASSLWISCCCWARVRISWDARDALTKSPMPVTTACQFLISSMIWAA